MSGRHYAPEGVKTSINCSVTDEEFIGWFDPSGQQISSNPLQRLHVRTNGSAKYLEISKINRSDRGTYECRGKTNKAGMMLLVECRYKEREEARGISFHSLVLSVCVLGGGGGGGRRKLIWAKWVKVKE